MPIVIVLIIVMLVAANALYVAAEFAAVSVRRSRIQQLAEQGNRFAQALRPVVDEPARLDRYVAACQIGITLSSLLLGAYGQATIPGRIEPAFESLGAGQGAAAQGVSATFVLLGLTTVQVVVGELVPKSLALQYPTQVALLTTVPMRWSMVAFRWFIAVLNGSANLLLAPFGRGEETHRQVHSPEEIELLIVQSNEGGLLSTAERRRLRSALQLGARAVHQVMIHRTRIEALDLDEPAGGLIEQVMRSPYTRLPVYRESIDNISGTVHAKEIAALPAGAGTPQIESVVRPLLAVPESLEVDRLLQLFREQGGQMAIVIDEFAGVAGLVTIEDVLGAVFGSFGDEFRAGPGPERLPDGRLRLPGSLQLIDAAAWIGAEWTGQADTVGGHVIEALGRIPEAGDVLEIDGASVEIEAVEQHTVQSVLVGPRQGGSS